MNTEPEYVDLQRFILAGRNAALAEIERASLRTEAYRLLLDALLDGASVDEARAILPAIERATPI